MLLKIVEWDSQKVTVVSLSTIESFETLRDRLREKLGLISLDDYSLYLRTVDNNCGEKIEWKRTLTDCGLRNGDFLILRQNPATAFAYVDDQPAVRSVPGIGGPLAKADACIVASPVVASTSPGDQPPPSASRYVDIPDPVSRRPRSCLGGGVFGRAYKMLDTVTSRVVVVKEIPCPGRAALDRAVREALRQAKLRHPSVLACHDLFHGPETDAGDQPANVLLQWVGEGPERRVHLLVGDFGEAQAMEGRTRLHTLAGTDFFCPPEMLLPPQGGAGLPGYTQRADWFSGGLVLACLFGGLTSAALSRALAPLAPWQMAPADLHRAIRGCLEAPAVPGVVPARPALVEAILGMLSFDPAARPGPEAILTRLYAPPAPAALLTRSPSGTGAPGQRPGPPALPVLDLAELMNITDMSRRPPRPRTRLGDQPPGTPGSTPSASTSSGRAAYLMTMRATGRQVVAKEIACRGEAAAAALEARAARVVEALRAGPGAPPGSLLLPVGICRCCRDAEGRQVVCLATEFCPLGNMDALVGAMKPPERRAAARGLVEALAWMQARRVAHGALKPANLVFRPAPAPLAPPTAPPAPVVPMLALCDFADARCCPAPGAAPTAEAAPGDEAPPSHEAAPAFAAPEEFPPPPSPDGTPAPAPAGPAAPDARADLFAGGLLLACLLGPMTGPQLNELLGGARYPWQLAEHELVGALCARLSTAGLEGPLVDGVAGLLARDPALRPAALARCAAALGAAMPPVAATSPVAPGSEGASGGGGGAAALAEGLAGLQGRLAGVEEAHRRLAAQAADSRELAQRLAAENGSDLQEALARMAGAEAGLQAVQQEVRALQADLGAAVGGIQSLQAHQQRQEQAIEGQALLQARAAAECRQELADLRTRFAQLLEPAPAPRGLAVKTDPVTGQLGLSWLPVGGPGWLPVRYQVRMRARRAGEAGPGAPDEWTPVYVGPGCGCPVPQAACDREAPTLFIVSALRGLVEGPPSDPPVAFRLPKVEFRYHHDLDEQGLLYYIGTQGLTQPWRNPAEAGWVTATRSSNGSGRASDAAGRSPNNSQTGSGPGQWWCFDLGPGRLVTVARYTLRHAAHPGNVEYRLASWRLEGSRDGAQWATLDEHHAEVRALPACPDATATFVVGPPPPGAGPLLPARYVRVLMTGPSPNGGLYLHLSGFELYGTLAEVPTAPTAAPPAAAQGPAAQPATPLPKHEG
ncbi:putative e3 ubiquitin-protein ligase hectd1 [Paratrimastix pyriformis]|uniref:E3 ubiquitin-protein ligase hectd1 n=1 Tax=Paratrimastix pyriformis TaxID=342808 RepID=A0ABQ8UM16_9EUKA|nr:putative e3 ubiquitin-protein ligase hectd1 [Paratrimastix pyriformis]